MTDAAERQRELSESLTQKTRWMLELSSRTDGATGRPTQEQYDEAKRAAGIETEGDE
jgi:hypothetical protein